MTLNIKTIRDSFDLARPHALKIVSRFYEILWQDYPELKPIFSKVDMEKQKTALVGALAYTVAHLDNTVNLEKYLRSMGARHLSYGVVDEHYGMVGSSLLKTLGEAFGDAWTPDLAQQWTTAVGVIASLMQEGAASAKEKPKPVQAPEPTAVRIELPVEIRDEIRLQVRAALQEAIQKEIQLCIQDELKSLHESNVYELLRKRA